MVAEFNQKITSRMYDVAVETSKKLNLDVIHTSHVPGIFDMPLAVSYTHLTLPTNREV